MPEPLSSMKRIASGAVLSYVSIALDVVLGLIYTPWMISQLGQSDYGVYGLALSVIAMITMDFGIGSAASKYICEYRVKGDEAKIDRLLGVTFRLYLLIDLIIAAVLTVFWFLINNIYVQLTPEELERFKTVFLITGACCLLSFPFAPLNGILNAYERFAQLKLLGIVSRFAVTALTVAALFLGRGLYTLVLIQSFVQLAVIVLKYRLVRKETRLRPGLSLWDSGLTRSFMSLKYRWIRWQTGVRLTLQAQDSEIIGRIFGFSVWVTLMTVLRRLTLNLCPSILGIVSTGTDAIAVFNVGRTIHTYAATLTGGLSGLFLFRVTKMGSEKSQAQSVTGLMTNVGRIQFILTSFLMLSLILYGREFFSLWIGPAYSQAYYVTMFLMLPMLVTATQEIANTYIVVQSKVYLWAVIDGAAAVSCVCLSFVLGRLFGASGVALAYLAASVLAYIAVSNILFVRVLQLDIKRFFIGCHLKLLLPVAISGAAGYGLKLVVPSGSVFCLIVKAAVFTIVFISVIWLAGLNKTEKDFVCRLLSKLRRALRRSCSDERRTR